jgi:8-oxo-dGTP pyrophosphatase MutT (NUDIX family)
MANDRNTLLKRSRVAAKSGQAHPPSLQVAALCWRRSAKGKVRILLISSRDTGRWVIPKGWPMRRRTHAQAAEREAYEEAGVRGDIVSESVGFYSYRKRISSKVTISCVVQVYPLHVHSRLKKYPESGQRTTRWVSRKKAMKELQEPELKALVKGFDPGKL